MKKLTVILLVLVIAALGFLFVHVRTHRTADSGPAILTNNGFTWNLGSVTINGTNVPASNISIRVIQSSAVPRLTNMVTK